MMLKVEIVAVELVDGATEVPFESLEISEAGLSAYFQCAGLVALTVYGANPGFPEPGVERTFVTKDGGLLVWAEPLPLAVVLPAEAWTSVAQA